MKCLVFTGGSRTGKSMLSLYVGTILTRVFNRKVIVIDTTNSQSMYSFFETVANETTMPLTNIAPITVNNMDILVNNPIYHTPIDYKKLTSRISNAYDYLIIEADNNTHSFFIENAYKTFMVQTQDKHSLIQMFSYLSSMNINPEKLHFIFNKEFGNLDIKNIVYSKLPKYSSTTAIFENEDIEIEYEEQNESYIIANQYKGIIETKKLTKAFKYKLLEIVGLIEKLDEKTIKRLAKKI